MASVPPIIAWEYQFAPNAQKARNYLYATNTPFKICEQPFVLPRPILQSIGITYRRVPVLSIGKDVFCDTISFMDALQGLLEQSGKALKKSPADRAYEAWGYRSFWVALSVVPASLVTEGLAKDRIDLFPVFARKDFAELRKNALGELQSFFDTAENDFLTDEGPFIGGAQKPGMADIHASWMLKWAVQTIDVGKEPGFHKEAYPRFFKWVTALQIHDEAIEKDQKISEDEAKKTLFDSTHAVPEIGVDKDDPTQLKEGQKVSVEATDAEPGTYPQHGKLVGLNKYRTVVELDNGLRVHFPRIGYTIKTSS